MKTLGIDFGQKRVGIAISDDKGIIASPLETINRKTDDFVLSKIKEIVEEKNVEDIVMGIPLSANSKVQEEYKEFAKRITEETKIEPKLWDETFSTKQAQNMVAFFEPSNTKPKTKDHRDKVAAAVILQEFLDNEEK
jgi:putative Holliday junction resolvase